MIEPIIGERQCAKCGECKLLTEFSAARKRDGSPRPHSYCKACRNQQAKDRTLLGRRKDRQVRRPARVDIWPRPLGEALLDVRTRRWRYPVEAGALAWRLA